MKRTVFLLTLLGMMLPNVGCAGGDGVGIDRRERAERHRRIFEMDMKQLNDDWDTLWLNDRPSRLTEWKVQ